MRGRQHGVELGGVRRRRRGQPAAQPVAHQRTSPSVGPASSAARSSRSSRSDAAHDRGDHAERHQRHHQHAGVQAAGEQRVERPGAHQAGEDRGHTRYIPTAMTAKAAAISSQ